MDSLVHEEIGRRLTYLREQNSQSETDITLYDTSLPKDSVTGLHPVKAQVKHRSQTQCKDSAAEERTEEKKSTATIQTTDKGTKTNSTQITTKEKTTPTQTKIFARICGLLLFLLIASGAVVIIKNKRKKSK
jgi:hypothetical protein